ncbi:hypothetical protein PLEOSDRAFT_1087003 [Pleurotus ostreatus PC15]|uniref:Uncharacterized protein n=1 Tax=Pleurotus ostreatus (strain PC15) TaxID=1137138 RepID=A0A067N3D0_PLEO1|nr:hypothetical protein PLEOSDRAFT_1087003 [Pleurotus ostreatus PC15]
MSLKTFDSTITDVRESFLRNSPRTNVLQLLRREDYRKGIPETVKEPVRLWLRGLKEPDTNASLPVYRSELRAPSTGPNILPSITTPQVHFATKPPVVHVPGYGSVQDTQGGRLSLSLTEPRQRNDECPRRLIFKGLYGPLPQSPTSARREEIDHHPPEFPGAETKIIEDDHRRVREGNPFQITTTTQVALLMIIRRIITEDWEETALEARGEMDQEVMGRDVAAAAPETLVEVVEVVTVPTIILKATLYLEGRII